MKWKIEFISVQAEDDFFLNLKRYPVQLSAAVYRSLERLEDGNLPPKYIKALQSGVFEIKTSFQFGEFRTLFFYQSNSTLVITHGFIKKTEKTPKRQLEKALNLRTLYLRSKQL